jgi:MoxR-like ATPase
MKPSKIFDILNLARRARNNGFIFNPLFVGPPGVGKSHIVQAWAKQNSLPFIDLRIAYMEAPDLIGFPSIEVKDGRQITVHNLPEFLPVDGQGVLLLEEPNRGTTSVMNCLMQLLTDRKIHKYTLPEGWIIVGCINPEGEHYDVNTMDSALRDRFEMFSVTYDKPSFVEYMNKTSWHKDIINFVESNMFQYRTPEEVGNVPGAKYVSPRTLSKLNAAILSEVDREDEQSIYETILGSNVAKDFYNFRYNETPVMMSDLLNDLHGSLEKLKKFSNPENYKNGMISLTVRDILQENTISDELLAKVVEVLPVEQSTALIRDLEIKRNDDQILVRLCKQHKNIKELLKSVVKYGK